MIHNKHSTKLTTTTLHHFDSIKWKKRLFNLSHKLHRSHNNNHWNAATSATAMAAATEKFIRHSSNHHHHHISTPAIRSPLPPTSSDEIAIHSEDLTASQFANLTGIKTRNNSNSIYYSSASTDIYAEEDDSDEDEDDEDSRDFYYSTTSVSSSPRQSHQPVMRIWDSHFWQDNNHRKSLPLPTTTPLTTTTSMTDIATPQQQQQKLYSQPLSRHTSEPGGAKVPSMIQKGRFKIVWGQDDTEPIIAPESHCVEWKRKRASSNSSSSTAAAAAAATCN